MHWTLAGAMRAGCSKPLGDGRFRQDESAPDADVRNLAASKRGARGSLAQSNVCGKFGDRAVSARASGRLDLRLNPF